MAKEPITTRLDSDTKTEVENYADDRDIGQTEAARRLIRAGLAAEGHPVATTDGGEPGPLERLGSARTALTGALLLALGIFPLAGAGLAGTGTAALGLAGLAGVLFLLGLLTIWAAVLAQLTLGRPLRALARSADTDTA
jgi:hypothetical protein